jgi:hypothetical protein
MLHALFAPINNMMNKSVGATGGGAVPGAQPQGRAELGGRPGALRAPRLRGRRRRRQRCTPTAAEFQALALPSAGHGTTCLPASNGGTTPDQICDCTAGQPVCSGYLAWAGLVKCNRRRCCMFERAGGCRSEGYERLLQRLLRRAAACSRLVLWHALNHGSGLWCPQRTTPRAWCATRAGTTGAAAARSPGTRGRAATSTYGR